MHELGVTFHIMDHLEKVAKEKQHLSKHLLKNLKAQILFH